MSEPRHLYLPVQHCARCGGDHQVIAYKPFVRPPEESGTGFLIATHWGYCPVTGDPILMTVTNRPNAPVDPDSALADLAMKYASWPVEPGYTVTVREGEKAAGDEQEREDDDR